jgi:heterodisulfide reductase subunit A-like polyferredoxin
MKKPVLVLGGGIAGIQASSDLAEMGVPVFIVESTPSIGGRMAQLDKTFPTNDCSACILAPKVTACYNHPLIKTFTWSELLEVKGEAPNFTAVIKQKPRYIDEDSCKGCNDCTLACPIEAKSEFDMGMGKRHAIYKPYPQAVPNKVVIDKKGTSPCKYACPAHIDAHGYVTLIGQGRNEEALEVIRRTTPFAGVLGRVCFHPCESNCNRQYVEDSLSIASLKRFAADYEIQQEIMPKLEVNENRQDKKVAIIGSGPAGLNCAYQLALMGYSVTIFEALSQPGGMLKVGIPDYRLNKQILAREIQIIQDLGVEIKCNTPISDNLTVEDLRKQGYQAFFLGIGAHKDMKLNIPGEDSPAVVSSVEFLRKLNLGQPIKLGKKVFVIGGGNVAMDAARSAIRLGCDVTVLYRRTEQELPASVWEVEHAKAEGVKFEFLTAPVELLRDEQNSVFLKCEKNCLGQLDASGRRRPEKIPGSEYLIAADTIITAIGQTVETELLDAAGISCFDRKGRIICDAATMRTNGKDIFAGGDAVTGPDSMIGAVAAGNKAAKSIYNYLEGENIPIEPFLLPETPIEEVDFSRLNKQVRATMPLLDMNKRVSTFDEVELGYTAEQAVKEALRCVDCSICCECKACEKACQSKAVRHEQTAEIIELAVSSVIWANGFDVSDKIPAELGYARYEDVVTSMEYERILSASGPFQGHVQRPSDGKAPKRIAFLQCVGSRDSQCDSDYCSAVCCMYAVKEAQITKEHLPSVEDIDIYYMDMRAYGKDFDKYINSAKNKYGIKFIRSRVGGVSRDACTGNLILKYCAESGGAVTAEYDMIVLSVGLSPKQKIQPLLAENGIKTDQFGFIWVNEMKTPNTSKIGMLACGVAAGPKDIPETVVEASAAASEAAKIAGQCEVERQDYNPFFMEQEEPVFRDVSKEAIRIGVFICHCGVNIGGYLNVDDVVAYAETLPFVAYAGQNLYTCSVDAQKVIAEKIKEFDLNRVVVASCTPRTHEPLFQSVLAKAGLNPYLFTMANIRDQCSWVHMDHHEDATAKAQDLVKMAVGKVTFAKQLTKQKISVNKSALVIGGGLSGITASREIAGMGYQVYLVEKSSKLGGSAARLNTTSTGRRVGDYLQDFIDDVRNNPLIEVRLNTEIKDIDGYVGNYSTVLTSEGIDREISHGVVIVATGAAERQPDEYLYGIDKKVITQLELEEVLKTVDQGETASLKDSKNVVMIQCVGSRDDKRPYCSRVCCNQAIKNAIKLKEINEGMNVTILYRDVRAYGLHELNYKAARNAGVKFIHYEPEYKPQVFENNGKLIVKVTEPIQQVQIILEADALVLSSAIVPEADGNKKLAQMLKVPMNQDGFFMEAHAKLRPVDFATEGVYLCGLAHAPKNMRESIVQGKAAAARAATVISKDMLETEGTIAKVDETLCTGCGTCEKVCAYKAITIEAVKLRSGELVKKSKINPVLCKGCGTCSATCRCGAIDVSGFSDRQIINEIEYLLRK